MSRKNDEDLLREYVRNSLILLEDDAGGNPYIRDTVNYGDNYYGASYGDAKDLVNTFITPFTDIFKTAVGKSKEITRKAKTVLQVSFQTIATTIIPFYAYDYNKIFEKEKEDIKKIREEYKDVYERTDKALRENDAALIAFMAFPKPFLVYHAARKAPAVTKDLLTVVSGGVSDDLFSSFKEKSSKLEKWALGGPSGSKKDKKESVNRSQNYPLGPNKINIIQEKKKQKSQIRKKDNEDEKTSAEIFASEEFLTQVLSSPKAQEMQKEAREIYKRTLQEVIEKAEEAIKNTKTIKDIEKHVKSAEDVKSKNEILQKLKEIEKLPEEEKSKSVEMLISGIRKATKKFYEENLQHHVTTVIQSGIPESSPYVQDYKNTIQKIKSM